MVTIKDIAKHADVSVATVSYVINNTRPVHPEKKARVLKAIKELNYVPNATARGLRAKKNQTIGLVIPDITNPFYPDLAKGCQDVAQENGFTLMMFNTDDKANQLTEIIKQARGGKIDGLILANLMNNDDRLKEELLSIPYPMVLAHRKVERFGIDSVISNDFDGAYNATKHLMAAGHKKIMLVDGTLGSPVSDKRRNGYLKALDDESLSEWIVHGYGKYEKSYQNTLNILSQPSSEWPTAIFATSDIMALGAIDAIRKMKLSVPKDIAVMGYDDLFIAASPSIELSTVKVPRYEIGKQATKLLLNKMDDGDAGNQKVTEIILQTEIIVRKTCGYEI